MSASLTTPSLEARGVGRRDPKEVQFRRGPVLLQGVWSQRQTSQRSFLVLLAVAEVLGLRAAPGGGVAGTSLPFQSFALSLLQLLCSSRCPFPSFLARSPFHLPTCSFLLIPSSFRCPPSSFFVSPFPFICVATVVLSSPGSVCLSLCFPSLSSGFVLPDTLRHCHCSGSKNTKRKGVWGMNMKHLRSSQMSEGTSSCSTRRMRKQHPHSLWKVARGFRRTLPATQRPVSPSASSSPTSQARGQGAGPSAR